MQKIVSNIRERSYLSLLFVILISFSFGYLLRMGADLPRYSWWIAGLIISSFCLFFHIPKKANTGRKRFVFIWSGVPILCAVIYIWFEKTFGEFDIGSILFHLEMGAENTATDDVYKITFKFIVSAILILLSLSYLAAHDKRIMCCDRLLALPIFIVTPFFSYLVGTVIYYEDNSVLNNYYIPTPKGGYSLVSPPKNIILIYAESTERTFAELDEGPEVFQEMMRVAEQGVHVKGIQQVVNTGWTVAGLVSSQCGIPLQPMGLMKGNSFTKVKAFLPGVVCISDMMNMNGYHTEFLNGADLSFAGMNSFLSQHGYQVTGAYDEHKDRAGSYLNSWGLFDDTLLEVAESRVHELQQENKPFFLTVMTIGGHSPVGHPTQTCLDKFGHMNVEEILFSAKCTGYHIESFIDNLRKDNLLNNTVVIVLSDHLVMQNPVRPRLEKLERMNYFTILSEDMKPEVITKKSAMFDVFPTVLEVAGFRVPERSAGLGVSLLSDRPSLIEDLGDEKFNRYIKYDKALSRQIWSSH